VDGSLHKATNTISQLCTVNKLSIGGTLSAQTMRVCDCRNLLTSRPTDSSLHTVKPLSLWAGLE